MTTHSTVLKRARVLARRGSFSQLQEVCLQLQRNLIAAGDVSGLLQTGSLLLDVGLLADAHDCLQQALSISPNNTAVSINLANIARESGDHEYSRQMYVDLLARYPYNAIVRRNLLVSLEYDPQVADAERLNQAKQWGKWAEAQAGGPRPRPAPGSNEKRPLRVGYLSADLCQHTVGLLVKDTLKAHDRTRVTPIAYHAGKVNDWVTNELRAHLTVRDVAALDDAALTALIRQDKIDILVDLSGHTAGSRLTIFAHRPAPVQVSWLGYFATTGLDCIDAVLLDDVHAPPGTETQFVEPIIRLPMGRWCYQPVPFAPEVAPLPADRNGHITFGSFNNTAKYHADVHALWAQVLIAVPNSRLVLKWRTFNDEALRQSVLGQYTSRGIDARRIELRGPSFHVGVLKEYADIDIALDPFPFSGGLTSCEALWMGVPVVTWPQSRVVSRQTASLLYSVGMSKLVASTSEKYVRIALALASDRKQLAELRSTMREKMRRSALMDVETFTRQLEAVFLELYRQIKSDRSGISQ